MSDGVSNDPVIASTPTPLSVEPRVATPAEAAEVSRQAEEAKVAADSRKKDEPAKVVEPVADKPKPSIRDAIRAAEKKVNADPVANTAKPISVVAKEAPAADAKVAEPAAKATEPAKADAPAVTRGEDGKFVSTKTPEPAAKVAPEVKAPVAALPSHTAEPAPKRFSAEAKEEWAAAPEKVRAEVARMEKELTAGFEKNRAAAERDAGLAEFHEMAGKSQKQLKDVVAQYVGMENLLRADTIKGLELICQNAGLSLREVAAKVLGQTPDQNATAQDATIRDLNAKIARLEQGLNGIQSERQAAQTNTTTEMVTKFAADPAHSRFEELSDDISFFLKSGRTKDLAEAYQLAELLNPVPAAQAQASTETAVASSAPAAASSRPTLVPPVAHTDAGARSIAGTPTAGSDPVRKQPSSSIKEAIRRATAAAR
jgi:outer membrane murein-binding lipoprotein Lpp